LKDALSVETTLTEGGNGVFEVMVDGNLVFSKKATNRFPDAGEVVRLISGK
jgi:selT/selW/selH-like putative selenoprotein